MDLDFDLLGGRTPVDSIAIVEICVQLEDLAIENGFEFDWTSENAMSRTKGVFRTAGSLWAEFENQYLR